MEQISLWLAFSAGLLSFLSPCVLPLVPGYLIYISGSTLQDLEAGKQRWLVVYRSLAFVVGFSFIFILMGAAITTLGQMLAQYWYYFIKASGILIIILGIHTTGLIKIKWLYTEKRFSPLRKNTSVLGTVLLGMAFAAGWTPCVGPILSSILVFAGSMDTIEKGIYLLVAYSFGLGVPFILVAVAMGSFKSAFQKISRYMPIISIISGVLLVVLGIMIFTDSMTLLIPYLDFIPSW